MTRKNTMIVKIPIQYHIAIVASALICMSASFAETGKHSEKELPTIEQHAPHEHGAATLSIAIDANQLEIDLESPADNIFGFEYAPSSDEDKQKVKDAVKQLKAAKTLFTMPESVQCHLDQVDISSPMLEHTHGNNKESMEHHDKKNSKEHHEDHAKKESNDHDAKDSDKHHHVHNDVDASWHYSCQSTEQLKSITPHFFTIFSPGFTKLKVEWLTPSGASSRMITEDKRLDFKGASE